MNNSIETTIRSHLSDVLNYLSSEEISDMIACGKLKQVDKNVRVFEEGEDANALYLILKGKFAAIKKISDGKEVTIAERSKGSIFGEMGVLEEDNPVRSATVIATEEGEIIELSKMCFKTAIENGAAWASKLMFHLARVLSFRLRELSQGYTELWRENHAETINEIDTFSSYLTQKWNF